MSSAQDKATGGYEAGAHSAGGPPQGRQATANYPEAGYQRGAGTDYESGGGMAQAGGTVLAATLLMLSGLFSFFEGLVAILKHGFFVNQPNYTFQYSIHNWGWFHLIIGIVVFAAGACVLLGQTWAKALGIVLAVFSGIASFLFLPYYPVWSIVVIGLDVFVIWALASSMGRRANA
jgi:hypothetical protein